MKQYFLHVVSLGVTCVTYLNNRTRGFQNTRKQQNVTDGHLGAETAEQMARWTDNVPPQPRPVHTQNEGLWNV